VPNVPHHVTQRGNRRQRTFFGAEDYEYYLELLERWLPALGAAVWSYCLMPNHVHLVVVPESETSLARAVGEVHRRYSKRVNCRKDWRGYLWQGRFYSCPVESESYIAACVRYVLCNPVRARLVARAADWPYSNASALSAGRRDSIADHSTLLRFVPDWRPLLNGIEAEEADALRLATRTGRPFASDRFIGALEQQLGRALARRRPGRKPAGRK